MMGNHLGTDELYKRTRAAYSGHERLSGKRPVAAQTDSVVRLTVVTHVRPDRYCGDRFSGNEPDRRRRQYLQRIKLIYFMLVFIPAAALTVYTVVKSKRLAEFLEALSNERLTSREKLDVPVPQSGKKNGAPLCPIHLARPE